MLKVFYNSAQSTDKNLCESPSAGKPAKLVEQWQQQERNIELVSDFEPVTREQLYRVHAKQHVNDILDCRKENGFYNKIPEVAETLPWTSGSMVAAAMHAYNHKTVTMSPTSGFHHAERTAAMGFCTFNGLMLAAMAVLDQDAEATIGILDLDHHYGNGTADIIDYLVDTDQFHRDQFHHYTFGGDRSIFNLIPTGSQYAIMWKGESKEQSYKLGEEWLERLPSTVGLFKRCDVVLYQAGADPHISDPHGGALTDDQLRRRDEIVFETLKATPVAWNLAGGYQRPLQKVLDIHNATLEACLGVGREFA